MEGVTRENLKIAEWDREVEDEEKERNWERHLCRTQRDQARLNKQRGSYQRVSFKKPTKNLRGQYCDTKAERGELNKKSLKANRWEK